MLGELREPAVKKTKGQPYFTPELAYILASCEERIPLVNLGLEVKDFYQLCDHQPHNYLIYLIKRTVFVTIKKTHHTQSYTLAASAQVCENYLF